MELLKRVLNVSCLLSHSKLINDDIYLFIYLLPFNTLIPFRLSEDAVNTLLNHVLFNLGTTLVESQPSILQKDTE